MTEEVIGKFVDRHLEKRAEKLRDIGVFADTIDDRYNHVSRDLMTLEGRMDDFQKTVGDPVTAFENFKATVVEELKLKEARLLWTQSAERAKNAYIASCVVLVLLLVGVPVLAILNSAAIFAFFHALGQAVLVDLPENATETAILIAAVSRLVLVTLPVALFIWLIRIVVRFNMRSLLLMDDARQRNTMLETYLHLVEQDKDVRADRPLVLEALFRRTPGHGPDTIEPPNLSEVLKLGNFGPNKGS
ncbi:hypothetical protein K9U38_02030 [Phyllobacterium sp. 2063]|nr:hypothetical protein [Phyllobacterium sp. 2063]